ncbi:sulfite exporter TauE/SafE family protein [Devosia nitrariae]|uniref:Probable membrane transporter protein n=1 Tax=Devosia nitrariae TaxID=2071872 RepID=A0ABQ5WBW6_9HYPH|nr:sulfite exporter TauE/SafE family protein [Devosia nitrariae]GLQ57546.1 membrane protein [Devosia nitrariae]
MDAASLAGLLLLASVAAYIQTLTGFAFGLVMMGGIGLTGLMSLPDAAVVVSVLTLVNATQVLVRGWRDVAWRELLLVLVAGLPMLLAGYWLLEYLAATSIVWLQLILGLVIVASSIQLSFKPHPRTTMSPKATFLGFGAVSGLMSGLFSTSGPPLIYHFYRQPWPHAKVRETLVSVFATYAVVRFMSVAASGNLPAPRVWWSLLAIPVVMALTFVAKRWPPPVSQLFLRRAAFLLLLLSGLSLFIPAALALLGAFGQAI